tara:strand:- start:821 stop:1735 length:915 start_codon:yes stop_codon:yes gene_type:complete
MHRFSYKLISIFLLIPFLTGCSGSGPDSSKYPSVPTEIDKSYCAKDGRKYGHTVIIIDKTSKLKQEQLDFMKSHIFTDKLYGKSQPFTRFSYILIDSTKPQSQKYFWSVCRPKKGSNTYYSEQLYSDEYKKNDELSSDDENAHIVELKWNDFMKEVELASSEVLKIKDTESKHSLIYETIIEVLRRPALDFGSDYPVRNLIIASDLMQHSKRLSFYSICKTNRLLKHPNICPKFKTIEKDLTTELYLRKNTPKNIDDINIHIVYVNNRDETKASLDETLLNLWMDYFEKFGFKKPSIERMVDTN